MKYKQYHKIGVELEGGWSRKPRRLKVDTSVQIRQAKHTGEVVSPPMSLIQVLSWVKENYPEFINETCGLHIHISLNKLDYSRCMSEKFNEHFLKSFRRWGKDNNIEYQPFWDRLDGKNGYCIDEFDPDKQIIGEPIVTDKEHFRGSRYTQLNYACFRKFGTFENRVLPVFPDIEDSLKAIRDYITMVHAYLKGCEKPKPIYHTVEIENFRERVSKKERYI